jgi:long-chain fatty acid transport protein
MAGVAIALPQDSVEAANNPAGMALVGTRFDVDVQTVIAGEAIQYGFPGNDLATTVIVPVPEGGFNIRIGDNLYAGVSVFGTGIVSSYNRPLVELPNVHNAYAKLTDYILAPTLSYRINDWNAVGFSFTGALQGIQAQGVLVPTSNGLQQLPVHSTDLAPGYGFRLGYISSPFDWLSIGIDYDTKIRFSKFQHYGHDLLMAS